MKSLYSPNEIAPILLASEFLGVTEDGPEKADIGLSASGYKLFRIIFFEKYFSPHDFLPGELPEAGRAGVRLQA